MQQNPTMGYLNDIRELIGNTPLLKINNFALPPAVNLFAKLELFNPLGSVKDRIGVSMLRQAEQAGQLRPGATIIEATAGNTGLGLALAIINTDYKIILVVPDKFSQEKQTLMQALGAKIINTPTELGMKGAFSKAEELLATIPNSLSLRQFENQANPLTHYQATGPEIQQGLAGLAIDYFVAGAGTGGTFSGVASYLKQQNPNLKAILVDPIGSTIGGGHEASYAIEGIGNSFVPTTMEMSLVNEVIKVGDKAAYSALQALARHEGLIVGSTSGAVMAGCLQLAQRIKSGTIVTIFPDRGDRYFSKNIFAALESHKFDS